jgi:HEAT repeat protein
MKALPHVVLVLAALAPPAVVRAEPVADGWPLSAWLGRLNAARADQRARVVLALRDLGAEAAPAVPVLIDQLGDESDEHRQEAADTLVAIGQPAVGPLSRALADADPTCRTIAARALGEIGAAAKKAAPALVEALTDPVPEARLAAAEALWLVDQDAAGVPVLAEGLAAKDIPTRQLCARLLAHIGPSARAAVPALIKSLGDESHLDVATDRELLRRLMNTGRDSDGNPRLPVDVRSPVRSFAAAALARIGPDARPAVPALKALLRRTEKADGPEASRALEVRVSAALALLELGAEAESVLPVLLEGFRDPDCPEASSALCLGSAQYAAVVAACRRLGPVAVPALVRALDDREPAARSAAVEALEGFPTLPKEVLPGLRRLSSSSLPAQVLLVQSGEKPDAKFIDLVCELADRDYLPLRSHKGAPILRGLTRSPETSVPLLTRALESEKPAIRTGAAQWLSRLGPAARAAAPTLRRVLKEEPERRPDEAEWPARTWALVALVNMGEPDAVPLLIQTVMAFGASGQNLRGAVSYETLLKLRWQQLAVVEALAAAAKSRESRVLPLLIESLGIDRSDDRETAAVVLRRLHEAKAAPVVKSLADALLTGNAVLRAEAAKLLRDMGRDATEAVPALQAALADPDSTVRVRAAAALWRLEGKADDVLPTLREGLKDPTPEVSFEALEALGRLGTAAASCLDDVAVVGGMETFFRIVPDAVPALIDLLGHREEVVREWATELLGRFGPAAVAPLAGAVRGAEGDARRAAVEALWLQGAAAREALPVLRPLLDQPDRRLRFSAALAVWVIGSEAKETLPIFLDALRRADVADRRRAAGALGGIGERAEGAAPVLEQALSDEDDEVRSAAATALASVPEGERALSALVRASRDDPSASVRRWAIHSATLLARNAAAEKTLLVPLTAALKDRSDAVRTIAMSALRDIEEKAPAPVAVLIDLLDDDTNCARAREMLVQRGESSVPALTAALTHRRVGVRLVAADALGELGAKAKHAVPELICALQASDVRLRYRAAVALSAMGAEAREALPALRAASEDEDEDVRNAAAAAVRQIASAALRIILQF